MSNTFTRGISWLLDRNPPVPTIVTWKRGEDDWIAHLEECISGWETGRSEAEAIGKLHKSRPTLFGTVVSRTS